jgi:transposase-like protein
MASHLDNPIFHDEDAAREWFEARIWPDGPFCPHCGSTVVTRLHGKAHRPGLFQCNDCREQFTVTVNTVCERSKIPLSKWCMAIYLLNSSKKGMSALEMHRMMGGSYKTAWFMMHRIREAMNEGKLPGGLGGQNKVVEADETYIGGKAANRKNKILPKAIVLSLVERDGSVRSFRVPNVSAQSLRPVIVANVGRASYLMTDEAVSHTAVGREFAGHGTVNHSAEEYVRAYFWTQTRSRITSPSSSAGSSAFTIMFSEAHLHRYTAEVRFPLQ